MGITRTRHQGPREGNNSLHCSLTLDEFEQEEKLLFLEDHVNELDVSELSDIGCEYVIVGEQICSIPYELFDLPNLKEVLSLQTWNLYLTEEERFHLTAYLPDMDQETFWLTMCELLGGTNIFFGSPLEALFHRLSGGFYSMQVSQFRESLNFLNKRLYYHSLRSYHEEMRKAWSSYQPITNKNSKKPVLLVDLNVVPSDEELPSKDEERIRDDEVGTHVSAMDPKSEVSYRAKAKGVLKVKPLEMNSISKKWLPKGVLKIKPKGYTTTLVERPVEIYVPPAKRSNNVFGLQTEKTRNTGSRQSDDVDNPLKKMKRVKGMMIESDRRSDFGGQHSKVLCRSSAGLYQSAPDGCRRKMVDVQTMSEEVLINSTSVMDDYQMFSGYCDRMFPIMYRRKKPYTKLGSVPSLRQQSIVATMEPLAPTEADLYRAEKAESMKIRVRESSDFTLCRN